MKFRIQAFVITIALLGLVGVFSWNQRDGRQNGQSEKNELGVSAVKSASSETVGSEIARYKGVPAYQNGSKVTQSHGRHYAKDGYYYGQKWQCVEYVKRFYFDGLGHRMPSVWGHARDFFDPEVAHGKINPARGLVQYQNGQNVAPKPDDLLVFRFGSLGHVAIVTRVTNDSVEVIQQNVSGHPMSVYPLTNSGGMYTVGKSRKPAGWLRVP